MKRNKQKHTETFKTPPENKNVKKQTKLTCVKSKKLTVEKNGDKKEQKKA